MERITFLHLLVLHLLIQPGLEVAFTLLFHVQAIAHRDPQVLFCRAAAQVPSRTPLMQGVILDELQDFPSAHAEFHEVPVAPFLYFVQILSSTLLSSVLTSSCFDIVSQLVEEVLSLSVQDNLSIQQTYCLENITGGDLSKLSQSRTAVVCQKVNPKVVFSTANSHKEIGNGCRSREEVYSKGHEPSGKKAKHIGGETALLLVVTSMQ
ncbi:hypothetical protein DUI87_18433 [Hirundo rustica rustica]|uniref:Secreted protein n=1 Tax=Hirundo rustica rustica TaxID=333673 RepID=A0A3M0JWJ9_HIRRU|nr:hypothetical protein DUI87_18433 [Hirundo rustica rustica]